jgi:hypothetical protein
VDIGLDAMIEKLNLERTVGNFDGLRLEPQKGKLIFPKSDERVMGLTRDQLSWLLSGLNCLIHAPMPEVKSSNFY